MHLLAYLWYYLVRAPYNLITNVPHKIRRCIPFVSGFEKNNELDALVTRLSFLRASTWPHVPEKFYEIMKSRDGTMIKEYLSPYTDKMRKTGSTDYMYKCYRKDEYHRCSLASLIILWKL